MLVCYLRGGILLYFTLLDGNKVILIITLAYFITVTKVSNQTYLKDKQVDW